MEGKPLTFKGLNPPAIAYPTILLALVAVTVQIFSSYLFVNQSLGALGVLSINTVSGNRSDRAKAIHATQSPNPTIWF